MDNFHEWSQQLQPWYAQFLDMVQEFESMSRERVDDIVELHQQMDESYRRVCSKHGENYKYIEPHQFFGFVQQFVSEFQVPLTKR